MEKKKPSKKQVKSADWVFFDALKARVTECAEARAQPKATGMVGETGRLEWCNVRALIPGQHTRPSMAMSNSAHAQPPFSRIAKGMAVDPVERQLSAAFKTENWDPVTRIVGLAEEGKAFRRAPVRLSKTSRKRPQLTIDLMRSPNAAPQCGSVDCRHLLPPKPAAAHRVATGILPLASCD